VDDLAAAGGAEGGAVEGSKALLTYLEPAQSIVGCLELLQPRAPSATPGLATWRLLMLVMVPFLSHCSPLFKLISLILHNCIYQVIGCCLFLVVLG
jgi:hypothetical protein